MGKLNEIQEQTTQSWGSNSFTTKITDQTVEFDSAKDSFTFMDEVNVPTLKVNGQASAAFTEEEKAKLAKVTTPMNMKGRVDSVADLPTENVAVGDTYLVGPEGSEDFEEYVCTALEGSPATPVWENIGHIKVQPDWNQNNSNAEDYIKNRICYESVIDMVGQTLQMGDTGTQAFYFNIQANPIFGETYTFGVGSDTFNTTYNGGENGGSMGVTLIIDGYTSGTMMLTWDENGISGAPNGETAVLNVNGNRLDLRNKYLTITQYSVVKINDKFIPDTVTRNSQLLIVSGDGNNSLVGKNFTEAKATGVNSVALGNYVFADGEASFATGTASSIEYGKITLTYVSSNTFTCNYNQTDYKGCKIKKVENSSLSANTYTISDVSYDSGTDKSTLTISGFGSSNVEGYILRGAIGQGSHSEGFDCIANGYNSHSEGYQTIARGDYSHSEGWKCASIGLKSHSEGESSKAVGDWSHSEGCETIASGYGSHSEGQYTESSGSFSHSQGKGTISAAGSCSALGEYNVVDEFDPTEYPSWTKNTEYAVGDKVTFYGEYYVCIVAHNSGSSYYNNWDKWSVSQRANYVEIVGNGYSSDSRSNARTLDWSGNEMLAGTLTIGGASGATIKVDNGALKVSFDGGTTWLTISAS